MLNKIHQLRDVSGYSWEAIQDIVHNMKLKGSLDTVVVSDDHITVSRLRTMYTIIRDAKELKHRTVVR